MINDEFSISKCTRLGEFFIFFLFYCNETPRTNVVMTHSRLTLKLHVHLSLFKKTTLFKKKNDNVV